MPEEKSFKLNLSAIKWENNAEKNNFWEYEKKVIEKNKLKNNENEKINLSNMLGKKEEIKKVEDINVVEPKKTEDISVVKPKKIEDVFVNYKSDFSSEEIWILEKIKRLKKYIKPRTNIIFLFTVISSTLLWIVLLFITAPEIHNLENYKNNIINVKTNIVCKVDEKKCNKHEKNIAKININNEKKEEIKTNIDNEEKEVLTNKSLRLLSFNIDYKTKNIGGKEIIIYKGKEYFNIEDFNKVIEKEIIDKKTDKLINHLTNKNK